ncbi:hypothetical protein PVAND_004880 [Polypedilum vanderplanki]|uniref:Uncharacterized protein n=1 Tax=Polypedilum vanderplanki TaxID=319348 RepID=A0A9J6BZ30_POLVA|nr:hypothetical protein PVAND_004880 [Polypedilum vanderplanki]
MANYISFLLLIFISTQISASSLSKCPKDCYCDLDPNGRYYTECNEPGMKKFNEYDFDPKMEIIIIRSPKNSLTIGPLFTRFRKLETLVITGANIPAIGEKSFWGVKSLRTLDLSDNNLTTISVMNFFDLNNLTELNLSKNKIMRITSGTFNYLTNLRILKIADNGLSSFLPRTFQSLTRLRYLDLSGNPIEDLTPEVFLDIRDLKAFKCRKCNVKKVNPAFYSQLSHLTELDMGENQLQYLVKDEFKDLKYLRQLHLDGNQLSAIVDNLFFEQKSLEYLDLSRNRMRNIGNEAFSNLSNLTYLDISYNKLPELGLDYMSNLPKLKTLNISGNVQLNLLNVRDIFEITSGLRSLAIADITDLPLDIFVPLDSLQHLNVSGCRLGNHTHQILEPLTMLKSLDLLRNHLTGFDIELTEKLLNIENVRFEKNHIICDTCNVGPMVDQKHLMKWKYMPECYQPEHLRHRTINRLVKENLVECYANYFLYDEGFDAASTSINFLHESQFHMFAVLFAAIFVLSLLIIIISISICTRQRAHYYTREDGKGDQMNGSEKCLEGSLITGTEINFKFPLDDDHICTVDEVCLPPPPIKHSSSPTDTRSS